MKPAQIIRHELQNNDLVLFVSDPEDGDQFIFGDRESLAIRNQFVKGEINTCKHFLDTLDLEAYEDDPRLIFLV